MSKFVNEINCGTSDVYKWLRLSRWSHHLHASSSCRWHAEWALKANTIKYIYFLIKLYDAQISFFLFLLSLIIYVHLRVMVISYHQRLSQTISPRLSSIDRHFFTSSFTCIRRLLLYNLFTNGYNEFNRCSHQTWLRFNLAFDSAITIYDFREGTTDNHIKSQSCPLVFQRWRFSWCKALSFNSSQ